MIFGEYLPPAAGGQDTKTTTATITASSSKPRAAAGACSGSCAVGPTSFRAIAVLRGSGSPAPAIATRRGRIHSTEQDPLNGTGPLRSPSWVRCGGSPSIPPAGVAGRDRCAIALEPGRRGGVQQRVAMVTTLDFLPPLISSAWLRCGTIAATMMPGNRVTAADPKPMPNESAGEMQLVGVVAGQW